MQIQPLRVKSFGDSEGWRSVAMFDRSKTTVEDLRDEIIYGGAGPGLPFASKPAVVAKGKYIFVHQSGGLDI